MSGDGGWSIIPGPFGTPMPVPFDPVDWFDTGKRSADAVAAAVDAPRKVLDWWFTLMENTPGGATTWFIVLGVILLVLLFRLLSPAAVRAAKISAHATAEAAKHGAQAYAMPWAQSKWTAVRTAPAPAPTAAAAPRIGLGSIGMVAAVKRSGGKRWSRHQGVPGVVDVLHADGPKCVLCADSVDDAGQFMAAKFQGRTFRRDAVDECTTYPGRVHVHMRVRKAS